MCRWQKQAGPGLGDTPGSAGWACWRAWALSCGASLWGFKGRTLSGWICPPVPPGRTEGGPELALGSQGPTTRGESPESKVWEAGQAGSGACVAVGRGRRGRRGSPAGAARPGHVGTPWVMAAAPQSLTLEGLSGALSHEAHSSHGAVSRCRIVGSSEGEERGEKLVVDTVKATMSLSPSLRVMRAVH